MTFSLFLPCFFFNAALVNAPSSVKILNLPYFYYDGDAIDPNVQATIKEKFYQLLMSVYVPPFFCKDDPLFCKKTEMTVSPGIVSR